MKFRSAMTGNTSRNGTAFAASPFEMATMFSCNRKRDSHSRVTSRTWSKQIQKLKAKRFVLDGELVIPIGDALSFDELQLRLHPAASRVQKLAAAHPALFIVFDLLADTAGKSLLATAAARAAQKARTFARENSKAKGALRLSPATHEARYSEKVVR